MPNIVNGPRLPVDDIEQSCGDSPRGHGYRAPPSLTDACGDDPAPCSQFREPLQAGCAQTLLEVALAGSPPTVTVLANAIGTNASGGVPPYRYFIRINGSGAPFTSSVVFGCDDLGSQALDVRVVDACGDLATCERVVDVTDPQGLCVEQLAVQCLGGASIDLTGDPTLMLATDFVIGASGGTPPYSYEVKRSADPDIAYAATINISCLDFAASPIDITVRVTDSGGPAQTATCQTSLTITDTQNFCAP